MAVLDTDPTLFRHFKGHRGTISSLAFSPNMGHLASGSEDAAVMVWHLKPPAVRAYRFTGHTDAVTSLCFTPSGSLLASASRDRTVRLWILSVKGDSTSFRAHSGSVRSVDISGDGEQLLTAGDDKSIKLWTIEGQRFVGALNQHLHWVRCAKFSSDGQMVVSCSDDKTIKLWDRRARNCLHTFYEFSGYTNWIEFHPDGHSIAAACSDNSVKLWDCRSSYRLLQHYTAHTAPVTQVSFHPGGNFLISSSEDASLKIYDLLEGRLIFTLHGHQGPVNAVSFSRVVPLVDMEVPDYPVPPPPASARGAIAKPSPSTPRSPRSSLTASSSRPKSSRASARRSAAGSGGSAWGRGAVFASGGSDAQILLWRANFDRCTPTAPSGLKGEQRTHFEASAAPAGVRRDEKATSKTANDVSETSAPLPPPLTLSPLKGLENDSSLKSREGFSAMRSSPTKAPSTASVPFSPTTKGDSLTAVPPLPLDSVLAGVSPPVEKENAASSFSPPPASQPSTVAMSQLSESAPRSPPKAAPTSGAARSVSGVGRDAVQLETAARFGAASFAAYDARHYVPPRVLAPPSRRLATGGEQGNAVLEQILYQLDILTQTVTIMEERMTLTENKLREVLDVNATLLDRLASYDPRSVDLLRAQRVVTSTHELASRLPPLPPALRSAATYESAASSAGAGPALRAPAIPTLSSFSSASGGLASVHPLDRLGTLSEAPSLRAAAAVEALRSTSAFETLRALNLATANGTSEKPILINGTGPTHSVSAVPSAIERFTTATSTRTSGGDVLAKESTTSSRVQNVKRTLAAVQTTLATALESRLVPSIPIVPEAGSSAALDPDDSL